MPLHTKIAKRIIKEIATKGPRKLREVNEGVTDLVEEARQFLPLTRGGTGFADPGTPVTPLAPLVIPQGPVISGDDVRWKPTPAFKPTAPTFENIIGSDDVTPIEALTEVINNPAIEISPEMIAIINDASLGMNPQGEIVTGVTSMDQFRFRGVPKKKRKVSKYSREFGIQLKKLKKLHPRTKVQDLMKKAHRATKRAMK